MSSLTARKTHSTKSYAPPSTSSPKTRAAFTLQRPNSDHELKLVQKFKITQPTNDNDTTSGLVSSLPLNLPSAPVNTDVIRTYADEQDFPSSPTPSDRNLLKFLPELGGLRGSPLPHNHPDFTRIHKYIEQTQLQRPGTKVLQILKIDSETHTTTVAPNSDQGQRVMLWHHVTNDKITRVLEKKSAFYDKCGSSEADYCPGMHFSDQLVFYRQMVKDLVCARTKKIYRFGNWPIAGDTAYQFLCEVWLENSKPSERDWWKFWEREEESPTKFVVGREYPDPARHEIVDGVVWPLGPVVKNEEATWWNDNRNMYFVKSPNPKNVKLKYLVQVEL